MCHTHERQSMAQALLLIVQVFRKEVVWWNVVIPESIVVTCGLLHKSEVGLWSRVQSFKQSFMVWFN